MCSLKVDTFEEKRLAIVNNAILFIFENMPQKGFLTNSVTRKFVSNKRNNGFLLSLGNFGEKKEGLRSGLTRILRFLLSVGDRP